MDFSYCHSFFLLSIVFSHIIPFWFTMPIPFKAIICRRLYSSAYFFLTAFKVPDDLLQTDYTITVATNLMIFECNNLKIILHQMNFIGISICPQPNAMVMRFYCEHSNPTYNWIRFRASKLNVWFVLNEINRNRDTLFWSVCANALFCCIVNGSQLTCSFGFHWWFFFYIDNRGCCESNGWRLMSIELLLISRSV